MSRHTHTHKIGGNCRNLSPQECWRRRMEQARYLDYDDYDEDDDDDDDYRTSLVEGLGSAMRRTLIYLLKKSPYIIVLYFVTYITWKTHEKLKSIKKSKDPSGLKRALEKHDDI